MKNPVVDITNCDREPIHVPGQIQGHGYLVAVDKSNFTIQYISENLLQKVALGATALLDKTLEEFLQKSNIQLQAISLSQLLNYASATSFEGINPVAVEIDGAPYYLIAHEYNNYLIIEFESRKSNAETALQHYISASLSKILDGKTLRNVLQNAAEQVKTIIYYDRVMIYKFWEDGHGEVIAEAKNEDVEPFLGLHYPASDIPRQARELYKKNLTRIISDVNMPTSYIIAMNDVAAAYPLDLTLSTLRAVSPIHIQYLKNMGVTASFSVSLIAHGELWGLISCHNYTPKFIDFKAREGARLIGQILSASLEYRDDEESKEYSKMYRQSAEDLIRQMTKDWDVVSAFTKQPQLLTGITSAHGAALVFENNTYKTGTTPTDAQIAEIINWLQAQNSSQIFHTDSLCKYYKPAKAFADVASGLLACTLSKEMGEYILWFKGERIKTVNWAGNPGKNIEQDDTGNIIISPRRSFDLWSQQVENTSEQWSKSEISTVMKLREDIAYVINQKANQIRQLNERLKEAYEELDTFSFTISHDLKTPITSIKNYTEIILEENKSLNEDTIDILHRIIRSADKMHLLIKEVLAYSRISRKELVRTSLDMRSLIKEIVNELTVAYKTDNTNVVIKNTPNLRADKTMITQVFTNVIGNALKYSSKSPHPMVVIDAEMQGSETVYKIQDNGVGIDVQYGNQVYEIFKRMNNVQQFEGTGVGLSIVKRIMEKHNGKVWYESELGKGTIFYLSFINTAI
ncbi:GAF domain-containing protein [Ilyomonas limi]|uniref:histidine kinase n=1 Tax=Ilyomonas limi TaxID=2575867 RepID=A0A4U3L585_9BACT|nr:ATP-binding protein [Ilyomonas limi]TKK68846.1 GAF domain-containing protein [Ilyomonas limi]